MRDEDWNAHTLTLHTEFKLLGISDGADTHSFRKFLTHSVVVASLFGLPPQVRTTMHAGNIEHSNPFQRRAAEVQDDAITLRVKIQINHP